MFAVTDQWEWSGLLLNLALVGIYVAVGLVLFAIAYLIIDRFTPFSIGREILEKQNVAMAILLGSVFLGIARVAGETAPLLLTSSSNDFWPRSLNDFTPSLPVYIFNYAVSPYDDWHRKAWAAAFVLLVIVLLLNFGVRWVAGKRVVLASHAD